MRGKPCGCCGKEFPEVPAYARFFLDEEGFFTGYYWDCGCGSTLFIPVKEGAL